jgi:hypothetical protein
MFNDKFVVGLAYRWSAAMSAMVGFKFLKECILVMVTIMTTRLKLQFWFP